MVSITHRGDGWEFGIYAQFIAIFICIGYKFWCWVGGRYEVMRPGDDIIEVIRWLVVLILAVFYLWLSGSFNIHPMQNLYRVFLKTRDNSKTQQKRPLPPLTPRRNSLNHHFCGTPLCTQWLWNFYVRPKFRQLTYLDGIGNSTILLLPGHHPTQ